MSMTPLEMVTAFREWAELFLAAIPERVAKGIDPSTNYAEGIKDYTMEGLILWRHSLGDPRGPFSLALELYRDRVRSLKATNSLRAIWDLGPTPGVYLAWLLERRSDEELLASACPIGNWEKLGIGYAGQSLDWGLLRTLATGNSQPNWDDTLSRVRARKGWSLVADTYSNYMQVINAAQAGSSVELRRSLLAADVLYRKRARAGVYEPVQTEGGGPDNEHVVDYRIAAILVATNAPDISALLPPQYPHLWKWSPTPEAPRAAT